jgi:GTP cyclohydrolase I
MKSKTILTRETVIRRVADALATANWSIDQKLKVYGVPRGGMCCAMLCQNMFTGGIVDTPEEADVILDDIIDSGATRDRFRKKYPSTPFIAAVDKDGDGHDHSLGWVVFPWERQGGVTFETAEDNVRRLLQYIGEDPTREGLIETPKRFVKAMLEMTSGLSEDPAAHLAKNFSVADADPTVGIYDQIIVSAGIPFVSMCEHHLLPFDGIAHLAYLPSQGESTRIVGLSKLARCLEGFARRPQVQERLTMQVANAIDHVLSPAGCAVIIHARHTCQCFRGIKKDGRMVTSALRGVFKDNELARAELLQLIDMATG